MRNNSCIALLCGIVLSVNCFAGSSQVSIDCTSSDSKSSIKGYIPGDSADYNLSIVINGHKSSYIYECDGNKCESMIEKGSLDVVEKLYEDILIVKLYNDNKNYQGLFYAVPKSVKINKIKYGFNGSFTGLYEAASPTYDNNSGQFVPKKYEFKCKIKYQI